MLAKIAELIGLVPRQEWAIAKFGEYLEKLFSANSIKSFIAALTATAEIFAMLVFDTPTTPRGPELDLSDYSLVFYDEFDGDSLDETVWKHRGVGSRRGGYNSSSQAVVKDGNLILTGEYLTDGEFGEGWYTDAISLKEMYKQGYFEIRCICNDSPGYWSAFWIQAQHPYQAEYSKGGVGGAELDIFESLSYDELVGKDSVTHTIHCAGVDGEQEGFQSANLGSFYGNNIYSEYNTYGLEWTEDEYIFYVNGVETVRSTFGNGVSQEFEEVIVSLEIPALEKIADFDKDSFKTEYIVDYVKIYQKK